MDKVCHIMSLMTRICRRQTFFSLFFCVYGELAVCIVNSCEVFLYSVTEYRSVHVIRSLLFSRYKHDNNKVHNNGKAVFIFRNVNRPNGFNNSLIYVMYLTIHRVFC